MGISFKIQEQMDCYLKLLSYLQIDYNNIKTIYLEIIYLQEDIMCQQLMPEHVAELKINTFNTWNKILNFIQVMSFV